MKSKIKLLVISNNLISYNNANGKFIKNYLYAFSNNELCNFYISDDIKTKEEDFDSFNITDYEVLNNLKLKKNSKRSDAVHPKNGYHKNNNAIRHLLRYAVWKFAFPKKEFYSWVIKQEPTHIVTNIGNNPYLLWLALKISRRISVPLITIFGEDYPLKNYNFIEHKRKQSLFFLIFKKILRNIAKKIIKHSSLCIFNTVELHDLYQAHFKIHNSLVCYPPSDFSTRSIKSIKDCNNIVYAGNLGLRRLDSLIEIAEVLQNNNFDLSIDIYGKATEQQKELLSKYQNIKYFGFVSNDDLIRRISDAKVILHTEYNSSFNLMDLKYAFSTKIADMICTKKRILFYAPAGLAETNYLTKFLPNNVATSRDELLKVLNYVIGNNYDFSHQIKLAASHNVKKISLMIRSEIEKL